MLITLFSEAFAEVVTEFREARGMSKAALAEKAGLHQTYIGLLEGKERSPGLDTAQALAEAFGVPLSKMILAAEKKMRQFKRKSPKNGSKRH